MNVDDQLIHENTENIYLLDWPRLKRLIISNIGENVGKVMLSFTTYEGSSDTFM